MNITVKHPANTLRSVIIALESKHVTKDFLLPNIVSNNVLLLNHITLILNNPLISNNYLVNQLSV